MFSFTWDRACDFTRYGIAGQSSNLQGYQMSCQVKYRRISQYFDAKIVWISSSTNLRSFDNMSHRTVSVKPIQNASHTRCVEQLCRFKPSPEQCNWTRNWRRFTCTISFLSRCDENFAFIHDSGIDVEYRSFRCFTLEMSIVLSNIPTWQRFYSFPS